MGLTDARSQIEFQCRHFPFAENFSLLLWKILMLIKSILPLLCNMKQKLNFFLHSHQFVTFLRISNINNGLMGWAVFS